MAGIDTGGGHGKGRSVNQELPLIPFIDFLLCLVSFLLITAVWSSMARLAADAQVPGPPSSEPIEEPEKPRTLHVEMRGNQFQLVWRIGTEVEETVDAGEFEMPKEGSPVSYPTLAEKVKEECAKRCAHKDKADIKFDRAVLHTDNSIPFNVVVAVLDAINAAEREFDVGGGKVEKVPSFQVTFAAN